MKLNNRKNTFHMLILVIVLLPFFSQAQSAKDWYWPERNFNKVTFYTPDVNTDQPTATTRVIYYTQNGYYDKTNHPKFTDYEITDIQLINNEPGLVDKKTIVFGSNEVKIIKEESRLIEKNKTKIINSTQTIFKLPQRGLPASWINNGKKYTSSWTKITSRGTISLDAIKVVQYTPQWDAATIQYYVKGYGLVETIITQGKSAITIVDKFHQRLFDEDLYTDDLSKNNTFNFLKDDDIFNSPFHQSYQQTKPYFVVVEKTKNIYNSTLAEYNNKPAVTGPLAIILKYEELVINNELPNDPNVQTKYDDKDFRVILWNDQLANEGQYDNKSLKDLGYEYLGVTENDNDHITYSYRNCEKSLILDLTEWYGVKLSIYISWFSNRVKSSSGRFIGCNTR